MGYLSIDHRSTVDPTGTKDGILEEFDTRACPHCQAVIRVLIKGPCRKIVDSPGECDFCRRPICHACAERLKANEICPGEMREKIDRAWQGMRAKDQIWLAMKR
jgi:hypothetical protein